MAQLAELLSECFDVMVFQGSRRCAEKPDHRHRLLRPDGKRPSDCYAAQQKYQLAASHAQPLARLESEDYGSTGPFPIRQTNDDKPPAVPFAHRGRQGSLGAVSPYGGVRLPRQLGADSGRSPRWGAADWFDTITDLRRDEHFVSHVPTTAVSRCSKISPIRSLRRREQSLRRTRLCRAP